MGLFTTVLYSERSLFDKVILKHTPKLATGQSITVSEYRA